LRLATGWDPATKTEHFIRRATFEGKGRDFGFLVPTPAVPALSEVDDEIFDRLEEKTRHETVHVTRSETRFASVFEIFLGKKEEAMTSSGAGEPVSVLSYQKIAGYDAVVLEATDSAALQKWLNDHGYAATPDITEWLDAYVRQQWKITAFKIDATNPSARTSAVKMSFVTERPFFPYREPASQKQSSTLALNSRNLRVWFIGPERVTGVIGDSTVWPTFLHRSQKLGKPLADEVSRLSAMPIAPSMRMSAFLDQSSIRPGNDDLFFARDADQSDVIPAPSVVETVHATLIPVEVVVLAAVVIFFGVRRYMRRR